MIYVFQASSTFLEQLSRVENERQLVSLVMTNLQEYDLATRVKHDELDIAFAATGGPSNWVNVDNMSVDFEPQPSRATLYGDILVEMANGFVNLSTPAGFIPLVDAMESQGAVLKKQLS